jgi:hypothetical protein
MRAAAELRPSPRARLHHPVGGPFVSLRSRRRDEVRYTLGGAKRAAARWQHCLFDGFQEGHFRGGIGGGKELADWLVLQGTLGRDDAGGDIRGRVKMGLIR